MASLSCTVLGDKSFKGYEYDNSEKIALEPWQTSEILPVPAGTLSMPRDLLITLPCRAALFMRRSLVLLE